MPSAAHRPRRRPTLVPLVALVVTGTLAVLLWAALAWHLGGTVHRATTGRHTTADVVSCGTALLGPGCTVRYVAPEGGTVTRAIDHPGVLGVGDGDIVPLLVAEDGSIAVGGWRPWVDGLVLAVLALGVSSGAVRWFAKVLAAGDELTVFDLDESHEMGARDVG